MRLDRPWLRTGAALALGAAVLIGRRARVQRRSVRAGAALALGAAVLIGTGLAVLVAVRGAGTVHVVSASGVGHRSTVSAGAAPPSSAGAGSGSATSTKAPAPARATLPTPGASAQLRAAAGYVELVQVDAQHVIAAQAATTSVCGMRTFVDCRAALQQVAAAATAFQHDLDQQPAPACLRAADATIRSALGLYQQGAQLGLQGVGDSSPAEIARAAGPLGQATATLNTAAGQMRSARCGGLPPSVAP